MVPPVHKTQNTAFINLRLSLACPPQLPFLPGSSGSNLLQNSSDMSCLCVSLSSLLLIHQPLFPFQYNAVFVTTQSRTIATPDNLEHNRFAINVPTGWVYRTFKGNNGLIGVLWPKNTSFSKCDTAVFIFIQDFDEEFLPPNLPLCLH